MPDQITYIPASALRESPFNPRKTFSADALLDLAESIKSQGILQPIVVRPLPDGQVDIEHRYEIVFGHRRFRAASSLPEYQDDTLRLPCILRDMDDEQAAIAQVAENLQRADVTAIEEADSFRHLHRSHNLSADAIAERVGKSRSYVYARLKLAAAGADVRTAVLEQGLLPEVALEVARLRGDKLQRMGLQAIKAGDNEWVSQRRAKAVIRDMLTEHQLDQAPFDQTDTTLVHFAPACTGCSKRAGNDADLVSQGVPADVCTDAVCFGDKLRSHSGRVVIQLKAEGMEVIEATEAAKLFQAAGGKLSMPRGYTRTDYSHAIGGYDDDGDYVHRSVDEVLQVLADAGATPPAVQRVAIVHPESGVHATYITDAAADELRKALRDLGQRREAAARASTAASTPSTAARAREGAADDVADLMADWTPAERATTAPRVIGQATAEALCVMMARPRTTDDLRLMVRAYFKFNDPTANAALEALELGAEMRAADAAADTFDAEDWLAQRLVTMTADQLGQLVVGCAICDLFESVRVWDRPSAQRHLSSARTQVALASGFGIDLAAIAARLEEQTDDADGDAAGGSDATAEPETGDLFGGAANDQTDDAGQAGGPRAEAKLTPAQAWPFPKKAA